MKRLLIGMVGAAALLGVKFYDRGASHEEVKAHLVALCEGDGACGQAVETHFDACFEASYKMGGRRSSASLEANQLVRCLNQRAGAPYFVFADRGGAE